MGHPPRIPVWLPWERTVIYFVTICVADRRPVLANPEVFRAFNVAISKLRHWHVLAGIMMPDHVHVIVAPKADREAAVGNFSAALKRWMREQLGASWQWQAGCFDRLLRTNESLHDKWLYIRENPVRARLVQKWEDWPYRYEFNEEIGKRSACPTTLRRSNPHSGIRFPQ
jgi:REP element-mobilizing transposase RayT